MTLNATVANPAGTDIEANVPLRETGVHELALRAVPAEGTPNGDAVGCTALTDRGVATGLEYPRFVVTMDGREVLSVDQGETTANRYPLPTPLNATEIIGNPT